MFLHNLKGGTLFILIGYKLKRLIQLKNSIFICYILHTATQVVLIVQMAFHKVFRTKVDNVFIRQNVIP